MGFGDQPGGSPDRINGTWQLRRISSVVVNGDTENVHTLYQKDTHKGIILSTPLLLPLKEGKNTITVGGLYNGFDYKGADLDRIVVYPPEGKEDEEDGQDGEEGDYTDGEEEEGDYTEAEEEGYVE